MIAKRAHHFNSWLDGLVSGRRSTGSVDSRTAALHDAAREVHHLAAAEQASPPTSVLPPTWEDFMTTHGIAFDDTISATTSAAASTRHRSTSPAGRRVAPVSHRPDRATWFTRSANLFLTLLMVAGLAAGGWLAADRFNLGGFGKNEPPTSIPFAAMGQDDATPFGGPVDPATLPKAEDCTVEPLTVDEVIWYVTDSWVATASEDMENIVIPTEYVSATPPATNPPNFVQRNATEDELLAARDTQHMYVSCVMADSYFQMWATMSPDTVARSITDQLRPLTSEEDLRAMLTTLQENGPVLDENAVNVYDMIFSPMAYRFDPEYPGYQGIPVLDTDPANSWRNADTWLNAGYWVYDKDGNLLAPDAFQIWDPIYTDVTLTPDSNGFVEGFTSCTSYEFTFNEARDRWLLTKDISCEAILIDP